MRRHINYLAFSVALALGACVPQNRPAITGPTEQEAAASRAKPYNEGMQAVRSFASSQECSGQSIDQAKSSIVKLNNAENIFTNISAGYHAQEARDRRLEIQFLLADSAKKKGCLDLADDQYRDIINTYVGSAFSGIRDRAKLGIDDIREMRRNAKPSSVGKP